MISEGGFLRSAAAIPTENHRALFVSTANSAHECILKSYKTFREHSPSGHKLPFNGGNPIPHLHYEVTDPKTVVAIIGNIQKEIARS